jgi:hypothetical protein
VTVTTTTSKPTSVDIPASVLTAAGVSLFAAVALALSPFITSLAIGAGKLELDLKEEEAAPSKPAPVSGGS